MNSNGYGPATENDPRLRTADGQPIVDGGRYYDFYDCRWVTIEFGEDRYGLSPTGQYWNGWFTVYGDDGRRGSLNGERMASYEPRR